MTTRRERLERKLEKREDWAAGAQAESNRRFETARTLGSQIPLGQPILVGHHSEKRHRRQVERIQDNAHKGVEALHRSEHHASKADGLQAQLDRSIFSDDDNAVEAIEARIAQREAQSERIKAINKAIRAEFKNGDGWIARVEARLGGRLTVAEGEDLVLNARHSYAAKPDPSYPPYHLSNLRGRITADRERLKSIKARAAKAAEAEAAGGVVIKESSPGSGYTGVTFAEKPEWSIISALKAAGFHWSGGSWYGKTEALPASVTALVGQEDSREVLAALAKREPAIADLFKPVASLTDAENERLKLALSEVIE